VLVRFTAESSIFDAEMCVTAFILSMYFNNIGVHGFVLTGAPMTPISYD
jgi:hypothetical protein